MTTLDFTKLFSLSYLLDRRPATDSMNIFALAILFAIFLVGSGVAWLTMYRKERSEPFFVQIRSRLVPLLFASGFVGLILVFFRWQGIPYFASRIWMIIWVVVVLVWMIHFLLYLLKKFPKERTIYREQQIRDHYLPKHKHK